MAWQRLAIRSAATGCCAALGSISWADGYHFPAVFAFAVSAGMIFDFLRTNQEAS